MSKIYWIEIKRLVRGGKWKYCWQIRCRNGRTKADSISIYDKICLCHNDALAFANECNLEVRKYDYARKEA